MSRAIVAKAADATFEIHTPIADQILRAITRRRTDQATIAVSQIAIPRRTALRVAKVADAFAVFTDHI